MPWFLIALIAVVAVVGLLYLLPKPEIENARAAKLGDFQFPRAQEGDPIPLIYGRVKLKSPNVLWYGDFEAVPITEKVKTGLFSSQEITTGYKYYIGMALGLCIGPDVTLHKMWAGKDEMWLGTVNGDGAALLINAHDIFGGAEKGGGIFGNCSFYSGANTQNVDAYLAGHTDGADTSMMPMMCWLSANQVYIGTSTNMRAWFFELSRYSNGLGLTDGMERIGDDMNGVEILFDVMTNKFSRRGMPEASVDLPSWRASAETVYNEGNGTSLKIEAANTAGDVVLEILRQIDGIMYQDPATGKIILKLIREDYDTATLDVLGEAEVEDVTNFTKTLWQDTINQVRGTYTDRDRDFTKRPVLEQDMANISMQDGSVRSTGITFPGVYDAALAQVLCRRELSALSVPMFKCDIRVNRNAANLKPGQAFKLNWPKLNLDDTIMRVQKYNLGTLKDGRITFTAVQDKFGTLSTSFAKPPATDWTPIVDDPANVVDARMWRAPFWFGQQLGATSRTAAYIFALADNPGSPTLHYSVKTEQDAVTADALSGILFDGVGTIADPMNANNGTIASIGIDGLLTIPGKVVATDDEIRNGINLAIVEDEIIAYQIGIETELTTVYRGLLGTEAVAHAFGTTIYFLGDLGALITEPFQENVLITAEYLAASATKGETEGDGITITYVPPLVVEGAALVTSLSSADLTSTTDGNEAGVWVGTQTVTWDAVTALDSNILLPGDAFPDAPYPTANRVLIKHDGSTVVDTLLSIGIEEYTHTFLAGVEHLVTITPETSGTAGEAAVTQWLGYEHDPHWASVEYIAGYEQDFAEDGAVVPVPVISGTVSRGATGAAVDSNFGVAINEGNESDGVFDLGAHPARLFGTGDFTIEGFAQATFLNATNYHSMLGNFTSTDAGSWRVQIEALGADYLSFSMHGHPKISGSTIVGTAPFHYAISRNGDTIRVFLNGVMDGKATGYAAADIGGSNDLFIGGTAGAASKRWRGYLDEIRITAGVGRYGTDASFTVPVKPYPRG